MGTEICLQDIYWLDEGKYNYQFSQISRLFFDFIINFVIIFLQDCLAKQGKYSQYTENLLETISSTVNSLKYDVTLVKNCIKTLKPEINTENKILPKNSLPKLSSLCILATVIGKLQVLLDESISKAPSDNIEASK